VRWSSDPCSMDTSSGRTKQAPRRGGREQLAADVERPGAQVDGRGKSDGAPTPARRIADALGPEQALTRARVELFRKQDQGRGVIGTVYRWGTVFPRRLECRCGDRLPNGGAWTGTNGLSNSRTTPAVEVVLDGIPIKDSPRRMHPDEGRRDVRLTETRPWQQILSYPRGSRALVTVR
jgi:hypothetical protein